MAYYLTKENRKIVEVLISNLKETNNELTKIRTNNPGRLENIVRSATKLEEYRWIGDRYIIKNKPGELWFVRRELSIEFSEPELEATSDEEARDFFSVLNILLLQKDDTTGNGHYNFSRAILSETELQRLQEWGKNKGFEIKYEGEILKVRKNG